jgi:hypothetical protein
MVYMARIKRCAHLSVVKQSSWKPIDKNIAGNDSSVSATNQEAPKLCTRYKHGVEAFVRIHIIEARA